MRNIGSAILILGCIYFELQYKLEGLGALVVAIIGILGIVTWSYIPLGASEASLDLIRAQTEYYKRKKE